ncbi:MAG: AsmA family protein [Hyphomicrobiaceae bacterium]
MTRRDKDKATPDHFRPRRDLGEAYGPTLGRPADHGTPPAHASKRRAGPSPARSGSDSRRLLRRLVIGGAFAFAFLVAVTLLMIALSPADLVRDQIVARVKAETGRDLVISGPTSFTLLPQLGVTLKDVALAGPGGLTDRPTVRMDSLTVAVAILPLFRRELAVEKLIVQRPVFDLRISRDGRRSWEMRPPQRRRQGARPVRLAQALPSERELQKLPPVLQDFVRHSGGRSRPSDGTAPTGGLEDLAGLSLGDVRVVSGRVVFTDERVGISHVADELQAAFRLQSLDSPLETKGTLVWRRETVGFDLRLADPALLLARKPVRLRLQLAAVAGELTFEGSLSGSDALTFDGDLGGRAPSLRRLAALLGHDLPDAEAYGRFEIAGRLSGSETWLALERTSVKLAGMEGSGDIRIETLGPRPLVKATLKTGPIDLNRFQSGRPQRTEPPAAPRPPESRPIERRPVEPPPVEPRRPAARPTPVEPPATPAPGAPTPRSFQDLLDRDRQTAPPGPRVKGYTKRRGDWSDERIDTAALGTLDVEARLEVAALTVGDVKLGRSEVTVTLKDSVARLDLADLQLYEGRGRARLTFDARANPASFTATLTADGVSALPLLKDAAAFDLISGRGRLSLTLKGAGRTERQIVGSLEGKGSFAFFDGAIEGFNLAGMIRAAQKLEFDGFLRKPTARTDFSELLATFTIRDGIARGSDLRMKGPLIRMTGAGSLDLARRTIDYTLTPKLVASLVGQGGKEDLDGLDIPVRVHGSWDAPSYTPDLSKVTDPDKIIEKAREFGKKFKGEDVERLIKGLLGR